MASFSDPVDDNDIESSWTDVLFSPPSISILILKRSDSSTGRIDRLLKVQLRDSSSAELVLYNEDSGKDELRYVLDLRTVVRKEEEEVDAADNLTSIFYQLQRDNEVIQFQVIPTSDGGHRDVQAFDFLLGQYSMRDETVGNSDIIKQGEDRDPNVLAQTLENTGTTVRIALRTGGRYTGHAIRYLGQQYTSIINSVFPHQPEEGAQSATADVDPTSSNSSNDDHSANAMPEAAAVDARASEVDAHLIERANQRRKWAEGVHSAASSVTGAVLYPVRWTGRMASELGGKGGSDRPTTAGPVSKAILDTVGGLGNGIMSVCKGVTEAIGEVGSAIGDSAMHHSTAVHGAEYAQNVTKHYVDAASEIGLAGYKVANVVSLGWQGVLVNAALEGTTFLVSLYEYLIGPVLLQGYMDMMQMPLAKVRRYFAVLRPWSIAFYKSPSDITRKPYKVVPTSMLDTLPKLRWKNVSGAKASVVISGHAAEGTGVNGPSAPAAAVVTNYTTAAHGKTDYGAEQADLQGDVDSPYWHRSDYDAYETTNDTEDEEDDNLLGTESVTNGIKGKKRSSFGAAMSRTAEQLQSVIDQLGGGAASHIEICTVDCSTFLLYPPEDMILQWFQELREATTRVETIAKRKSGAEEIALYRRLDLYPISTVVTIQVRRFVRTTPKPSLFDLFIRRRSEQNTATGGGGDDVADSGNADSDASSGSGSAVTAGSGGEGVHAASGLMAGEQNASMQLPVSREKATSNAESLSEGNHETIKSVTRVPESAASRASAVEDTPNPAATNAGPVTKLSALQQGNESSDDEGEYEFEQFLAVEEPGFLDGSYFDIAQSAALEAGIAPADRTPPAITPATRDGPSPSPVPESEGLTPSDRGQPPPSAPMVGPQRLMTAVATEYTETTNVVHEDVGAGGVGVQAIKRPFFTPELQCSMYPVAKNGTVLLKEKHRVSPAPLMTVAQYLQELRTMTQDLIAQIQRSIEEEQADPTAAEEQREGWIKRLGVLQATLDTHAQVNPEKLIADWTVYCAKETVVLGRQCNILSSGDFNKIEIKLNRRHSLSTHFSEWGIAEVALAEIPAALEAPLECWLPVMRRSTGEQIGVLLVELSKQLV